MATKKKTTKKKTTKKKSTPAVEVQEPIPPPPYFYEYSQNNSGGSFDKRLPRHLIIEAYSHVEASAKAKSIGVYFNGVQKGIDCGCCGDRWDNRPSVYKEPAIYGVPVAEYKGWDKFVAHVYRLDGSQQVYNLATGQNKSGDYRIKSLRIDEPEPTSGRWVEDD